MKKELVKLANHLDRIGHGDLADKIDDIVKSAQELDQDLMGDMSPIKTTPAESLSVTDDTAEEAGDEDDSAGLGDPAPPPVPEAGTEAARIIEEQAEAEMAEGEAFDHVMASNDAQKRIDKMAELLAGEFSTYVPGTFSR